MVCKNCGNPLEDGVKFCTKCGQRVEVVAEVKEAATETVAQVQETTTQAAAEVQQTVKEVQETVAYTNENVQENMSDFAENVQETVTEVAADVKEAVEGAKEKVKKFPKGVLIALAAIAVVLILVLANFKSVANTVNKMVSSEEKYYASVEKDEIKELASSVANIYDNTILEYSDYNNLSIDYGMEVELSEDASEMLAASIGADDGKPFTKMAADIFFSFKGDVLSAEASASLGKTDLLSLKGVADLKKGEAYGIIEDLTSKYIGVSFEEYTEIVTEAMEKGDEFIKLLPDKKTVESLLTRYMTIAVENIDGISEKKDTVKVGDIEQKCTAIRVKIKEKDLKKIAIAVLEEAKDDKELISLVTDFAVLGAKMEGEEDVDAKEFEEMFKAGIESALESAKEAEDSDDEEDADEEDSDEEKVDEAFIMNVWVNGKGEVIGREFKMNDETVFVYKMPEKGGKFAFKGVIYDGENEYILDGEGKKSSSSLSGDFAVKFKGEVYDWETGDYKEKTQKYVEIKVDKFDTKKIKEGYANGSFTFKLSDEFISEAGMGAAGVVIGNYEIKFDVKSNKDGGTAEIALMNKEDMFAKIVVNAKIGSGKSASLPKGILVEDEEDLIEWAKTLKFDKFIKKLEKAGLPVEIVEVIEEYCEEFEDELSNY